MDRRGKVNALSAAVVLLVALVGVVIIGQDSRVTAPEGRTTVTKSASAATPGTTKTTTETVRGGGEPATTTIEEAPGTPSRDPETTTTTQAGERTFLERALGDGGLVVLQVGVVLLAAFLAGALLQRVLLGDYSIKLGSLELAAVADASAGVVDAVKTLRADVEALKGLAGDLADTKEDIALVYGSLDLIEKRIDALD